ncbi:MAG: sulfatase-like hydrolase/transferase [Chloroflexi bacterium]|nr:sulfatase-like hydrolase/transferase [Chloroflexota bacterium]
MGEARQGRTTRRRFLGGTAAAAAGLAAFSGGESTVRAAAGPTTVRQGTRRPNILFFLVDEQRHPTSYESAALAQFRATYLRTQQALAQTGVSFNRHYVASVACVPSRTSLLTGHYPSLHGVSQTDGAAKSAVESDMYWLDASTVPTLGDYFRTAGYETYWVGKWHVSHADILQPGTDTGLASYDTLGQRDPTVESIYQQADRLEDYGFSGWIGREPHGSDPRDSGQAAGKYKPTNQDVESRDPAIRGQVIEQLQRLEARPANAPPWVLGASFLGIHDIALWGAFTRLSQLVPTSQYTYDFTISSAVPQFADLFDQTKFAQTNGESLSTKPRAQESFRDTYSQWMQPILSNQYYRYYYELHKLVDAELGRVYDALQQSRFFQDTIIVFTSDHGDLLGAHGGMHQKWYGAYEEAIHVPMIVAGPRVASPGRGADIPTSHADVIPTLLGLAGINAEQARLTLSASHTEAQPLVGRDLSGIVLGTVSPASLDAPIYYMTDDDPARGDQEVNPFGLQGATVVQPNKVDTVVTTISGQVWKYSEYRDLPRYWTSPNVQDVRDRPLLATPSSPGTYTQPYQVTVKTVPVTPEPRDYEMYNLATDPLELNNLALDPAYDSMQSQLAALLANQRTLKRLSPGVRTASGGTQQTVRRDSSDDKPRKETETQRQQRERTNASGLDDYRTEGNVVETHLDATPPSIVIGMRDGNQIVRLACQGGCPDIRVGDYVEADGVKETEQLFTAENVVVTRGGSRVR